jgi:hypothetical protein
MQGLHSEFFARMYRECLNQLESVEMPEIVENYTIFVCTALLVPELLQFIICKMATAAISDLGFRMIPTLYNNRSSRLVMPNLVENDIFCLSRSSGAIDNESNVFQDAIRWPYWI